MKQAPAIYTSDVIKAQHERDAQERKQDSQPDFIDGEVFVTNAAEIEEAKKNNWPVAMKNWAAKFFYTWGTWLVWTEEANVIYKSKRIIYSQPLGA